MKRLILILAIASVVSPVFSKTTSHTLDFGAAAISIRYAGEAISAGTAGIYYRGITYPQDYGFLYGIDIGVSFPLLLFEPDFLWVEGINGLVLSLKVPFGYRWPGTNSSMGFYLAGGPNLQTLFVGGLLLGGVGVFAELGLETNKTGPAGFHFGLQAGVSPLVFAAISGGSGSVFGEIFIIDVALRFGVSWRRAR